MIIVLHFGSHANLRKTQSHPRSCDGQWPTPPTVRTHTSRSSRPTKKGIQAGLHSQARPMMTVMKANCELPSGCSHPFPMVPKGAPVFFPRFPEHIQTLGGGEDSEAREREKWVKLQWSGFPLALSWLLMLLRFLLVAFVVIWGTIGCVDVWGCVFVGRGYYIEDGYFLRSFLFFAALVKSCIGCGSVPNKRIEK